MVVVAQLGARMHYAVPAILHRAGLLERFYTDIYAPPLPEPVRKLAMRYGPHAIQRWLGRVPTDIPREKIVSFPAIGLEYFRRRKSSASSETGLAAHLWAGKEFCRLAIHRGLGSARCIYTFNTACLELLECARERRLTTVMEQCSSPMRIYDQLLEREEAHYPQWCAPQSRGRFLQSLEEREQKEWENADMILCGSDFVQEGIRSLGGPAERCRVVPYGVREIQSLPRSHKHDPLRVLTVGAVRIMKGSHYALAAARHLSGKAEFRMVGQLDISPFARQLLTEYVSVSGAVPRAEIHRQFEWADVFLLPTLCEGSATVCYEALAHGLPVITTPNAGSVVRDGVDGFIVPIRDAAAIADRIERLADDSSLWAGMSANALSRASEYSFEKYGERLVRALQDACLSRPVRAIA